MPTRKQRRRRDKTFRHEYDLVLDDEEGNEVKVAAPELRKAKEKDAPKKTQQRGGKGRSSRAPREVPPPSWNRAAKRGGIMGALLFIVMYAVLDEPLLFGLVYGIAFVPVTYWMDRFTYRSYLRRTGKT